MPSSLNIIFTLGTLSLLSGCAAMPKDAGFGAIQSFSESSLNQKVQWHSSEASYQAANKWVEDRLNAPLDIATAVRIGLAYSPALQSVYADVGISQAAVVQASLLKNPGFTAAYMSDQGYHQSNFNFALSIADLITQPSRRHVAQKQLEKAQAQVELEIVNFIAKTKIVYIDAVATQSLVHIASQLEQSALAAAMLASEQYKSGSLNLQETAKQQITHLEALACLKQATSTSNIAHTALIAQLGLPTSLSCHLTLPDQLPILPDQVCVYDDIEPWVLEHRLDIKIAQKNLNLLCDQLGFTRKLRYLGALDLGLQNQNTSGIGSTTGPTVALELPLFDQGHARLARTKYQVLQAQMTLLDTVAQALSQVHQAQSQLQSAFESAHMYLNMIMPLSKVILTETQTRQGAMLASPYELLGVFSDTQNKTQRYIEALSTYWGAHAELERATGGILPPSTTTKTSPTLDAYPLVLEIKNNASKAKPEQPAHTMSSMPGMKM